MRRASSLRLGALLLALLVGTARAESRPVTDAPSSDRLEAGALAQLYPSGFIGVVALSLPVSTRDALVLHAGANLTDRRDWGEHGDEEGGGPGLGLSYRRVFGVDRSGWLLGLRADLWFLDIDWQDSLPRRTGSSSVTVLQPSAQVGYVWAPGCGRWRVEATLSLGVELNIDTDGDDVGEGAILLVGVGGRYGL